MSKSTTGLLAAAGAASLWAIAGVFGKILLTGSLSPAQLVFYRSALGSALILIVLFFSNKALLKVARGDLPFLAALGILGLALTQFTYYGAIQAMSVGFAILLEYLAPLWILLFERFWLKRPVTSTKVFALLLALLGCLLVSVQGSGSKATVSLRGVGLGLASGVCFATYGLMSQKAVESYREVTVLFYSLLFTTLFWGVAAQNLGSTIAKLDGIELGMVLYVAVLGTVVPFFLFILALKHLAASQVGIISTLEPVVASGIAWIQLGESLSPVQILGGLLVLAATTVVQGEKSAQRKSAPRNQPELER